MVVATLPVAARLPATRQRSSRLSVRASAQRVDWRVMQSKLKQEVIRSVPVSEVAALQSSYTLLDVRPAEDYVLFHPPSAVSVPLFGEIKVDSPAKLLKAALYAFNGMKGTDENELFVEQVAAAVPAKSKLLVICDSGGNYEARGL